MPNYLEINKNLLFQSASSAGTTIVGVNGSDQLTVTDNNGVTTVVGEDWAPFTSSYKVYTSKLTQTSTNPPSETLIENTLGSIPDSGYLASGQYYFNLSQSVDPNKIIPFIYPNSTNNLLSTYEVDAQGYNFYDGTFYSSPASDPFDGQVRALAVQPNGKILVGGNFAHYNAATISKIARLNDDGTLDTSFIYGGGGGFNNRVRKIVVQDDGKILVGGDFTQYNDSTLEVITECSGIVRLTNSGSVDPDFQSGPGIGFTRSAGSLNVGGGNVYDIVLQPDGKILVGGWFDSYNGTPVNRIIRLDASGSIDNTFASGDGFSNVNTNSNNDRVSSIALQSDGKIICAGQFDTYTSGSTYNCAGIIKLNSSGSVDTTFYNNIGTGFGNDWVNVARLQDDGKIVVGLNANNAPIEYNGTSIEYLTRLNSNGTLDTDFNDIIVYEGNLTNGPVNDIKVLTSGQIISAGGFSNRINKVSTNGYLVSSYNGGFDSICYVLEPQPYGRILVGGDFTTYSPGDIDISTTRLARLYSSFDVVLTARDVANTVANDLLYNTPVEIRQYI